MTKPNHLTHKIPPATKAHTPPTALYDPLTRSFRGSDASTRTAKKKVLVYSGEGGGLSKVTIVNSLTEYLAEGFQVVFKVNSEELLQQPTFYQVTQNKITKFTPSPNNKGTPDSYVVGDTYQEEDVSWRNLSDLIQEANQFTREYTSEKLNILNKTLTKILSCAQDDILVIGKLVPEQIKQIFERTIPSNVKVLTKTKIPRYSNGIPKAFVKESLAQKKAEQFISAKLYSNFEKDSSEFVKKNLSGKANKSSKGGNNLVNVGHREEIDRHALMFIKKATEEPNRLFFYIDGPDDLRLDGEHIIDQDGSVSFNQEESNLIKFIKKCRDLEESQTEEYDVPILLINWSKFSPNQRLSLNSIIDQKRKIGSTLEVPENIRIISLLDAASVDESFSTRHSEILISGLNITDTGDNLGASRTLFEIENTLNSSPNLKPNYNYKKIRIADCRDWKEAIYGRVVQKDGKTIWEKSDFIAELEANNKFRNFHFTDVPADFDKASFQEELRKIYYTGRVYFNGFKLNITPSHIGISVNNPIDLATQRLSFALPKQTILEDQFFNPDENRNLINSQTFETLFCKTEITAEGKYNETEGLIDEVSKRGESLKLFVNSPLSDGQWLRLMSKAERLGVELDLKLASGVSIPERCKNGRDYISSDMSLLTLLYTDPQVIKEKDRKAMAFKLQLNKFDVDNLFNKDQESAQSFYEKSLGKKNEIEAKRLLDIAEEKLAVAVAVAAEAEEAKRAELYGSLYEKLVIRSSNTPTELFSKNTNPRQRRIGLSLSNRDDHTEAKEPQTRKLFIASHSHLTEYAWHLLFEESLKKNFNTLDIVLADGVCLPPYIKNKIVYREQEDIVNEEEKIADTATKPAPIKPQVRIIVSNNPDLALDNLEPKPYAILGSEDILIQDLLGSPKLNRKEGDLENTPFQEELKKALKEGKEIVLKGYFSPEFLQMLEPILFDEKYKNLTLIVEDKAIENADSLCPTLQWLGKGSYEVSPMVYPAHAICASVTEPVAIYDLKYDLGEDSKDMANKFMKARKDLFLEATRDNQMVRLMGPSGIGKSSLIGELKKNGHYEVSEFTGDISEWAKPSTDGKVKILFIDESNIENYHFTCLSPLVKPFSEGEGNRRIFFNGEFHEVGKNHKVVFACNPVSQVGGRLDQKLFEGDAVTTIGLQDFPTSYIYETILKDSLYNDAVKEIIGEEEEFQKLCLPLVDGYRRKNKVDAQDNPETVRKLQEDVMKLILQRAKEQDLLTTGNSEIVTSTYLSTPSTKAAEQALIDSLDIRGLQREGIFPEGRGLNAVIFEGQSGAGKSVMIEAILHHKNIRVVKDENPEPNTEERVCYEIKASWNKEKKERIIRQAYKEGNAVWIDEINSCLEDGLEKILNSTLTGKTGKPGFMLISSINSADQEGRSQISPALLQRSVKVDIDSPKKYELEDLQTIVKQWLMDGSEAEVKARHKTIIDRFHFGERNKNDSCRHVVTHLQDTVYDGNWSNCFCTDIPEYANATNDLENGYRRSELGRVLTPLIERRQSVQNKFLSREFIDQYSQSIAELIQAADAPNLRLYKEQITELAPYYFYQYYRLFLESFEGKVPPTNVSPTMPVEAKAITKRGAGELDIASTLQEAAKKPKHSELPLSEPASSPHYSSYYDSDNVQTKAKQPPVKVTAKSTHGSAQPTIVPSVQHTIHPTIARSPQPTVQPTVAPRANNSTATSTRQPAASFASTLAPTEFPSRQSTQVPFPEPTQVPSAIPTPKPSGSATYSSTATVTASKKKSEVMEPAKIEIVEGSSKKPSPKTYVLGAANVTTGEVVYSVSAMLFKRELLQSEKAHEWRNKDVNLGRNNNLKIVANSYKDGEVDEMLKRVIIATAGNMDEPTDLNGKLAKAIKVIEFAKSNGGAGSKAATQKLGEVEDLSFEDQKWYKEFSKNFQINCKKCGIFSGRGVSSVGLRTAYVPESVLKDLKSTKMKNLIALGPNLVQECEKEIETKNAEVIRRISAQR